MKHHNIMEWYKTTDLSQQGEKGIEKWIREENGNKKEFELEVFLGKKTNLLKLKKNIVEKIKKNLDYYQKTRTELYNNSDMEDVLSCPVCSGSSKDSTKKSNIYGAQYVQCNICSHVYVIKRPAQKTIHDFYLNNITYAATYTDKSASESRLNSIAMPWAEWTINLFEKYYQKKPKKILDVGSGAGHFVEACRRKGLIADGIELSESSRQYSKEIWGIELDGNDFVKVANQYLGYDIVTFWGLLEHTPNPGVLLNAAYAVVNASDNGMVISKLPRWNSLSSAIQTLNPNNVIRHLDPMGHIMAFTDASAAELYFKYNLKPIAAWYYGMDIYETLMQFGNLTGQYENLINTGEVQVELQQFIDEFRASDGLTLAGATK
jgi:2-polyprenyl-3-methyl-5-hydroxy-6-metoxy-1,4-benzoquinol methylase